MPRRVAAAAVLVAGAVFLFLPPQQPRRYDNDEYIYAHRRRHEERRELLPGRSRLVPNGRRGGRDDESVPPADSFSSLAMDPDEPAVAELRRDGGGRYRASPSEDHERPLIAPVVMIYLLMLGRQRRVSLRGALGGSARGGGPSRRRASALVGCRRVGSGCHCRTRARGRTAPRRSVRRARPSEAVAPMGWVGCRRRPLYLLHVALLQPYLVGRGTEERLLGTGSFGAMLDMAGFQLPAHQVVGALLWALAVVGLARTGRLALLGLYAMLPVLGLLADRPYWGAMVVPFLMVWACEGSGGAPRLRRARMSSHLPVPSPCTAAASRHRRPGFPPGCHDRIRVGLVRHLSTFPIGSGAIPATSSGRGITWRPPSYTATTRSARRRCSSRSASTWPSTPSRPGWSSCSPRSSVWPAPCPCTTSPSSVRRSCRSSARSCSPAGWARPLAAAVAGALAFGMCSYRVLHINEHPTLVHTEILPVRGARPAASVRASFPLAGRPDRGGRRRRMDGGRLSHDVSRRDAWNPRRFPPERCRPPRGCGGGGRGCWGRC